MPCLTCILGQIDVSTTSDNDDDGEDCWESVLDKYGESGASLTSQSSLILQSLRQVTHDFITLRNDETSYRDLPSAPAVDAIINILSSSRPLDEITGKLVEELGLDNLDLAAEILKYRSAILDEVNDSRFSFSCIGKLMFCSFLAMTHRLSLHPFHTKTAGARQTMYMIIPKKRHGNVWSKPIDKMLKGRYSVRSR
jgi:hypothetical protein